LRVVPIALYALAALLVWRVGRRTVGDSAARLAAILFWIWPGYFVWKSTRAHGYYGVLVVLGLLVLLLALRLHEQWSRPELLALGAAAGLGLWASPQIVLVAAPALIWLFWRRLQHLGDVWLVAAGGLLGAAPWLAWNFQHHWGSLHLDPGAGTATSYLYRLRGFFGNTLPIALGLQTPLSLHWLLGPLAGRLLLLVALAGFVWLLARRRGQVELLAWVALPYPFLYALSPFAWYVREPRYLVLLAPVCALLLARLVSSPPVTVAALAAALALSVVGLRTMQASERFRALAPNTRVPLDIAPLLRTLERQHISRAYANYWVAYRVTFLSGEKIIATAQGADRYLPYRRDVCASPRSAQIFVDGAAEQPAKGRRLRRAGYRQTQTAGFIVYLPPTGSVPPRPVARPAAWCANLAPARQQAQP